MLFTPRNIAHTWGRVKHVVGSAWSLTGRALHTADRYMDVAARLVNSFDGVAPQKAMQGAKEALGTYNQTRSRIQDVRDKTEGVYKRARGNVPELF